jgi:hypothetical protein
MRTNDCSDHKSSNKFKGLLHIKFKVHNGKLLPLDDVLISSSFITEKLWDKEKIKYILSQPYVVSLSRPEGLYTTRPNLLGRMYATNFSLNKLRGKMTS